MEVSIAVTGFLQQVRFVFLPRRSSLTRERGLLLDFRSMGQEDRQKILNLYRETWPHARWYRPQLAG